MFALKNLGSRFAMGSFASASNLQARFSSGNTDLAYNAASERFVECVMDLIDRADSDAVEDTKFDDGVLNVETEQGTWVLNKQAPKRQLWLSSPISGPHHYDMVGDGAAWRSDRDGHLLHEKLTEELTQALEKTVEVPSDGVLSP